MLPDAYQRKRRKQREGYLCRALIFFQAYFVLFSFFFTLFTKLTGTSTHKKRPCGVNRAIKLDQNETQAGTLLCTSILLSIARTTRLYEKKTPQAPEDRGQARCIDIRHRKCRLINTQNISTPANLFQSCPGQSHLHKKKHTLDITSRLILRTMHTPATSHLNPNISVSHSPISGIQPRLFSRSPRSWGRSLPPPEGPAPPQPRGTRRRPCRACRRPASRPACHPCRRASRPPRRPSSG